MVGSSASSNMNRAGSSETSALKRNSKDIAGEYGMLCNPSNLDKGEELRKLIGAVRYLECSSKTQQNVKAVFDTAIRVALRPPKAKKKMKLLKPKRSRISFFH